MGLEKNLVRRVLGERFLQGCQSVNPKKKMKTHVGKDDTAPDHCFRRQRDFRRQNGDANLALDFPLKLLFAIDS